MFHGLTHLPSGCLIRASPLLSPVSKPQSWNYYFSYTPKSAFVFTVYCTEKYPVSFLSFSQDFCHFSFREENSEIIYPFLYPISRMIIAYCHFYTLMIL